MRGHPTRSEETQRRLAPLTRTGESACVRRGHALRWPAPSARPRPQAPSRSARRPLRDSRTDRRACTERAQAMLRRLGVLKAPSNAGSSVTMKRSSWHASGAASLKAPRQLNSSRCTLAVAAARPRSGCAGSLRRHAGVVEVLVGEQRAVVAGRTLALADEQTQAVDLRGREHLLPGAVPGDDGPNIAVEARLARGERPLVRCDGLAQVGKHAIHVLSTVRVHALPGRTLGRVALRALHPAARPVRSGIGPKRASYSAS